MILGKKRGGTRGIIIIRVIFRCLLWARKIAKVFVDACSREKVSQRSGKVSAGERTFLNYEWLKIKCKLDYHWNWPCAILWLVDGPQMATLFSSLSFT